MQKNMPTEGKIRGSTQRILSCSFKGNMIYSQQKVSGKQTHKLSRNKKQIEVQNEKSIIEIKRRSTCR